MSAMLRTCKQEGMNTVTSVESTAPTNTYQCTDFKIKGCASSSSTTFSCLKLFANHHPFVKLWNAVIDLLETGKRKAGFWVHRGKLELKHNCWSCQQHPCLAPGYRNNQELPEARSTSLAESKLLGKPSSAAFASRLCSFAPVLETSLQGWADSEDGFQLLCTSQAKKSEAGEAGGTKSKK